MSHEEGSRSSTSTSVNGDGQAEVAGPAVTKSKWRVMLSSCCTSTKTGLIKLVTGDWAFLALLGIVMAFCSFGMDYCIEKIQEIHLWLYGATSTVGIQYVTWIMFTIVLVLFSAGFCHMVAPQAIGSGIPEMKTILRGVTLVEYLTFRTLISKVVGLTLCLGSGIPIGKEGPFVHVSSVMTQLLSKLISGFRPIFENESRRTEMLAAACAVGVACTFGAPIGGVLFSIEVTSVYFAVRNYWRAFFAATCSAIIFRLADVWFNKQATIVPFNKTSFQTDFPYDPRELFFYALVGVVCGFGGPFFVYVNRQIVLFVRQQKTLKKIFAKNRFIYPALVAFIISSLTFPPGYGQFIVGMMGTKSAIADLFSNFSWSDPNMDIVQAQIVERWSPLGVSFFVTLALFTLYYFCATALASTLPVPNGIFIPVFTIGASFGRIIGELLYIWFPDDFRFGEGMSKVVPGSYAVVGAAAFSGSVTHTVSTAMIVFELTGQIVYMIPVMLAVLIANAIASYLQPSFYDSLIRIKKLPYLPHMLPTASSVHNTFVHDFMVTDVKYISLSTTYGQLQDTLVTLSGLKTFPLVDTPASLILLGSIPRSQLEAELELQVGEKARREEANRRHCKFSDVSQAAEEEFLQTVLRAKRKTTESAAVDVVNELERDRKPAGRFSVVPVDPSALGKVHRMRHMSMERSERHKSTSTSKYSKSSLDEFEPHVHPKRSHHDTDTSIQSTSQRSVRSSGRSISQASLAVAIKKFVKRIRKRNHRDEELYEHDMDGDERKRWERQRLEEVLNFERINIDNAPFQLVEQTSLYKVHSLFSLLGLSRAYVTSLGRLVGVVTLNEIRSALEKSHLSYKTETIITDHSEGARSHHDSGSNNNNNNNSSSSSHKQSTMDKEGFIKVALQPMPIRKSASAATIDASELDRPDMPHPVSAKRRNAFSSTFQTGLPRDTAASVPEIRLHTSEEDDRHRGGEIDEQDDNSSTSEEIKTTELQ